MSSKRRRGGQFRVPVNCCQAKGLCKKAMDQLNELLELEGANYSFDMKKIKDAAEAEMFPTSRDGLTVSRDLPLTCSVERIRVALVDWPPARQADVSKSWMESAYPHPDEDDDDVSTEAPSVAEPGGVISKLGSEVRARLVLRKRGKDPYEEIQKLQKELAKLEAYRKVDQCLGHCHKPKAVGCP